MAQSLARKALRRKKRPNKAEVVTIAPQATPGRVPISVTMIVKDCPEALDRCLTSVRQVLLRPGDEIVIGDTGGPQVDGGATAKVALRHGARVLDISGLRRDFAPHIRDWLPEYTAAFRQSGLVTGSLYSFAEARQRVMDAAKHDVQFWIDSDDVLVDPTGRLRELVDECFASGRADAFFLPYHYSHDPADGSVTSILKRERFVDRRVYYWAGRCHETAIPRPEACPRGAAFYVDLPAHIRHIRGPERDALPINPSDLRNYVILRRELEETSAQPDPRTVFYLGNAARGVSHDAEAIDHYERLIQVSGSADDRYAASYHIGIIHVGPRVRRPLDALDSFFRCVRLKPDDPRGYFGLSRAYMLLGRPQEALHWFRVGQALPEPTHTLHNYDPRHIHCLPYQIAFLAAKELGMVDLAQRCVDQLKSVAPNHPETKAVEAEHGNWLAGRSLVAGVQSVVANSGARTGEDIQAIGREVVARFKDVPDELERVGLVPPEPPLPAGVDTAHFLTIYCGEAPEPWGPRTSAIGGSEKAVIQMAARLAKRGLHVRVFTNVPREQRGTDTETGVLWLHYGALDRKLPRGPVIFWRSPEMLEMPVPCTRRILWCHDVQDPGRWTPQRVALADEVWVLSEYHATTLGEVRAQLGDRVWVTRNGIDTDLFRKYFGKVERDHKKVVYASSPDRGLLTAIRIFKAANVPGSTLHIFYGFNKLYLDRAARVEYFHCPDVGRDISMYDYMQLVHQTVDQDDRIVWHGRVDWDTLAREMCSAGVWLYPTRFPEISCMAAMEAQAAGLVCVASDYAALAETLNCDTGAPRVSPDNLPQASGALRRSLEDPLPDAGRQYLHTWAFDRFDYDSLADEWINRLLNTNVSAA